MACLLLADPRELFFNLTKLMCQRQNGGLERPVFFLVTLDLRILWRLRVTQRRSDPGLELRFPPVVHAMGNLMTLEPSLDCRAGLNVLDDLKLLLRRE